MRVLVCGGRDYADFRTLFKVLDDIHRETPITSVIEGAARGADYYAGQWAKSRGIELQEFPADWDRHHKAAGSIRNKQMLDEGKPDRVIAFPGGKGTFDMINRAHGRGFKVTLVSGSEPAA